MWYRTSIATKKKQVYYNFILSATLLPLGWPLLPLIFLGIKVDGNLGNNYPFVIFLFNGHFSQNPKYLLSDWNHLQIWYRQANNYNMLAPILMDAFLDIWTTPPLHKFIWNYHSLVFYNNKVVEFFAETHQKFLFPYITPSRAIQNTTLHDI